jgi:recombination protein RecA
VDAEAVRASLNKRFGAGTVVRGAELAKVVIDRIPSGSLGLDVILGGGWPVNQWHEIIGIESSGKTTILLKTVATNMATDPNWRAFWLASETLDLSWAETLGVDLGRSFGRGDGREDR